LIALIINTHPLDCGSIFKQEQDQSCS